MEPRMEVHNAGKDRDAGPEEIKDLAHSEAIIENVRVQLLERALNYLGYMTEEDKALWKKDHEEAFNEAFNGYVNLLEGGVNLIWEQEPDGLLEDVLGKMREFSPGSIPDISPQKSPDTSKEDLAA